MVLGVSGCSDEATLLLGRGYESLRLNLGEQSNGRHANTFRADWTDLWPSLRTATEVVGYDMTIMFYLILKKISLKGAPTAGRQEKNWELLL